MLLIDLSDRIALEPSYKIESTYIVDSILGARHALNSMALSVMSQISDKTVSYLFVIRQFNKGGVTADEVHKLFLILNSIGALKISRRSGLRQRILIITRAILGRVPIQPMTHRYQPGLLQLCTAVSAATLPLLGLWLISLIALSSLGTFNMKYYLLTSTGVYCIMVLSLVAHEYAHILTLRLGQAKSIISRRGWRIGLLHTPISPHLELISASSGPILGGLVTLTLAYGIGNLTNSDLWIKAGVLLAIGHIVSLFPSYGDGWTILQVLRHRKAKV